MSVFTAGAGLSTEADPARAAAEACAATVELLDGAQPDLAVVFFTPDFAEAAHEIGAAVRAALAPGALLGCTAQGVIGGAREVERAPGVTVWAASMPQTAIEPFAVTYSRDTSAFDGWPQTLEAPSSVVMLADPMTLPVDALVESAGSVPVIGGMASGARNPGEARLLLDDRVLTAGAVGVVVRGRVRVRPLVSQGCRPIGRPVVVTRADRNVILEVAGESPLDLVRETFVQASEEERALMQGGLLVGLVVDEYKEAFERGDFLVRGVIGVHEESGAVAIGDRVEVGNTVQLHVRDASTADLDLREMLASVGGSPAAALLFTCNGRGSHLFGAPDHDAQAVQEAFGGLPLAGFFCAGEIGPVGNRTFLHGFTASMALFEDSAV